MRILLHGATHTTNFGDVLYAWLFYRALSAVPGLEVDFLKLPKVGIGDFCAKTLGYTPRSFARQLGADAVVLLPGGYLGDQKAGFKSNWKRYFRYIFPARIFQLLGKPVYLVGVGGGPLQSPFLRRSAVRMLNRAACIATRDRETAAYFSFYGVRRPIHTGTDPALVMDATLLHTLPGGPLPVSLAAGKHYLFLHLMDKPEQDRRMAQEVVPAVNAFLSAHPDWDVIAGTDECTPPERLSALASWRALRQERAQRFSYDDIFTLCRLLERMELVVTAKLHVGVVSASLGASVLSFPLHPEKTMRFYRQIGEEGRCFPLASLQQKNIAAMLDYYADTPIRLPESVRRDAAAAFSALTALFQEGEK